MTTEAAHTQRQLLSQVCCLFDAFTNPEQENVYTEYWIEHVELHGRISRRWSDFSVTGEKKDQYREEALLSLV
jgi:hypothetical protein